MPANGYWALSIQPYSHAFGCNPFTAFLLVSSLLFVIEVGKLFYMTVLKFMFPMLYTCEINDSKINKDENTIGLDCYLS